tara:strand:+ start:2514 stop:3263 length:750 start_codon:yes stop_codon:yes gene_type:complete
MAYNNLSGTVFLPDTLTTKLTLISGSIMSGNLSTSDGADVINVPRVSNATDNAIVTNVNGDANALICESNLTFDGSTLNIIGDLTASVGISASFYEGDGSRLTGLDVGTGGGIFTQINSSNAFTTSSILVGANTTPSTTLQVAGSSFMSGAVTFKRKVVSSNYSVSNTDYYLGVDSSNSTIKLTLPVATSMLDGQTIIVKDEAGNSHSNNITISGSASDLIDGQNQVILESPYASIQLYCNGVNKFFIC